MRNCKPQYETKPNALVTGEYRLQAWLKVLSKLKTSYIIDVDEERILLQVTCDATPEYFKLIQDGVEYEEQVLRYNR